MNPDFQHRIGKTRSEKGVNSTGTGPSSIISDLMHISRFSVQKGGNLPSAESLFYRIQPHSKTARSPSVDGVKALRVVLGCLEGQLERWQRPEAEALLAVSPLLVRRNCQRGEMCRNTK